APIVSTPYWPLITRLPPTVVAVLPDTLLLAMALTCAPSAPCTSALATPPAVPAPVITLPVSAVNWPAATLSTSRCAVGTSSTMLITRSWPAPLPWPSASVTTTAYVTDVSSPVLSTSV